MPAVADVQKSKDDVVPEMRPELLHALEWAADRGATYERARKPFTPFAHEAFDAAGFLATELEMVAWAAELGRRESRAVRPC